MSKIALLYFGTSFFVICGVANSATVTGSFVGTVYLFGEQENFSLPPGASVAIGDKVKGFFSFDTALAEADTENLQSNEVVYGFPSSALSTKLSFSINNTTWKSSNDLSVSVRNGVDYGSYKTFDGLSLVSENSSNKVTSGGVWPTSGFETAIALDFLSNANLVNSVDLPISKSDVNLSDLNIFGGINTIPLSYGSTANNGYSISFKVDSFSYNFSDGSVSLGESGIAPVPLNNLAKPNFDFVGDLAGDVGNKFNPNKPTIVLTHGWQRSGAYSGAIDDIPFTSDLYDAIKDRMGSDVNVVAFVWQDAYFASPTSISGVSDKILGDIGLSLGLKLKNLTGAQYDLPIQFIGHSLGSEVNVVAAQFLDARGLNVAQVTTLDAPIGRFLVPVAPYALLTKSVNIDLLDNYYGTKLTAFGGPISGWEFGAGGEAFDADHSGVWKEYLNTINDIYSTSGFYFSVALGQSGGFYTATEEASPGQPAVYNSVLAKLDPTALVHADYDIVNSTLALSTGSNGYASFQIEKPDSVTSLLLDLSFSEAGIGDFLEVAFDNELLGTFSAELYKNFTSPIFLDIEKFSPGFHEIYFLLVNKSQDFAQLHASNFRYFQPVSATIAEVPLPPSGYLVVLGIAALAFIRRKKQVQGRDSLSLVKVTPHISAPPRPARSPSSCLSLLAR